MNRERVLMAMSGGVDSSVAAYLLLKRGYRVIGVSMKLWQEGSRCCSLDNIQDARWVAQKLSIPFYTLNLIEEFEKEVVEYFCEEYLNARTPNPCIICNEKIKFGILLKKAKKLNVSFVATGHYAKVEYHPPNGRYCLKKGRDKKKDQSYFLFSLSQFQLSHTIFPLSNLTKEEVRALAATIKLPVHNKKESQEVCFIPQKDYNEFLRRRKPDSFKPGPILTKEGRIIGKHKGIPLFTIGQRRGLGGGRKKPLHVIELRKKEDAVIVGERDQVFARSMQISRVNWVSISEPKIPLSCRVKVRYQHPESQAVVYPTRGGRWRVDFLQPQWAITPGQAAVFYRGDTVLGGGWIERVIKN